MGQIITSAVSFGHVIAYFGLCIIGVILIILLVNLLCQLVSILGQTNNECYYMVKVCIGDHFYLISLCQKVLLVKEVFIGYLFLMKNE